MKAWAYLDSFSPSFSSSKANAGNSWRKKKASIYQVPFSPSTWRGRLRTGDDFLGHSWLQQLWWWWWCCCCCRRSGVNHNHPAQVDIPTRPPASWLMAMEKPWMLLISTTNETFHSELTVHVTQIVTIHQNSQSKSNPLNQFDMIVQTKPSCLQPNQSSNDTIWYIYGTQKLPY